MAVIGQAPVSWRDPRRGIVLLSTVVTILLLLSLVLVLQSQAVGNLRLLGRMQRENTVGPIRDAVQERLRGLLATAMTGETATGLVLPLNGTSLNLVEGGHEWEINAQDVMGVVDLYLAPREILQLLPAGSAQIMAGRRMALSGVLPGTRFPTVESTLARFGVIASDQTKIARLVTQSGDSPGIRLGTAPAQFLIGMRKIPPGLASPGQTKLVQVRVEIAEK